MSGVTRRRAQAETVSVVLLLGIVVVGTGAVVALGGSALQDTQQTTQLQRIEQTMTLFDARSATVALGASTAQSVQFGSASSGSFSVTEDSGWLRVRHLNYTAETPAKNETVYNASLGSLAFRDGDTTIAYEGGGVWRTQDGGTSMISPPEFHYRDATLMLPVIRVHGDDASAGGSTAAVEQVGETRHVYPNTTVPASPSNGPGVPYDDTGPSWRTYRNPVSNGTVEVTVHSTHYRGWKEYFETRTEGIVSVDHDNQTATVNLKVTNEAGDFQMPQEEQSLDVPSFPGEHGLETFTLSLRASHSGRDFNNLHWTLWEEKGDREFEMHVSSPAHCNQIESGSKDLDVSVYYYNGTASHEWQNQSVDVTKTEAFDVDCGSYELEMNLTGNTPLALGDIAVSGSDNKWHYGDEITSRSAAGAVTFDEHDADPSTGTTYSTGNEESLGHLVNHYFALLGPDFDLTVADGPGNGNSGRIDEGGSTGTLEYDTAGNAKYVTFLHITENEVRVSLR